MARLYGEIHRDRGNNQHFIANQSFIIELYYGSRDDSKLFATISVTWEKGIDKPQIVVNEK